MRIGWGGFLPALVLAPISIILGFKVFSTVLIYPLHLTSSRVDLFLYGLVPALVLLLASGLFQYLAFTTAQEYEFWIQKAFVQSAKALGKKNSGLFPIICIRSISQSVSFALPWLFGEIIVVEAIFNAPGIGFEIWNFAKLRFYEGLVLNGVVLVTLYGICHGITYGTGIWVGKKLEGYI